MPSLKERRPHEAALGNIAPAGEAGAGAKAAASLWVVVASAEPLVDSDSGCVDGSPNRPMLELWASSAWRACGASARESQSASRLRSRGVARDAPAGVREQLTASLVRFASGGNSPSVAWSGSSDDAAEIELSLPS